MPLDLRTYDEGLTVAFSDHAGAVKVAVDGQETWVAVSMQRDGQTERLPIAAHAFPETLGAPQPQSVAGAVQGSGPPLPSP